MSATLVTPAPEADAERLRRLRFMRAVALGLLVFAAVVFVATREQDGFLGYVNAGAEASMVGAIADWFAVTALFRHPLGLPIPHTALIPKRKDDLGRSLEDFVTDNFLQEEIIRDRVLAAEPAQRLGEYLRAAENAARVVREGAQLMTIALRRLRDEDVQALVEEVLIPRLKTEPISPIAGNMLTEVLRDNAHHGLVDLGLEELHRWLVNNHETFTQIIGERAPWWAPERLNEMVTDRLHLEAVRWLEDIRDDPQHHARHAFDSMLGQLSVDLLRNERTQERAERLKDRLLDQPQLVKSGMAVFDALKRALLDGLADEAGPLRERAAGEVVRFGERLGADAVLRERLDRWAADAAVFTVRRYGSELTAVITHTVERWDGKEAAERIELHVGRDLQFIRINGTIVGGLVGVLIHTIAELI